MSLKSYIQYRRNRVGAHGIHSPFVFEFFNDVVIKASSYDDQSERQYRNRLLQMDEKISVTDLGAGSKKMKFSGRKVREMASTSGMKPKYGRLLARIIDKYQVKRVLELGTSLGIGTYYLANHDSVEQVLTLEGCPETAAFAQKELEKSGLTQISYKHGNFDETLESALIELNQPDLIFIDGNHRYEPTMRYFNTVLSGVGEDSFIIFDDIHWSDEMEKAWNEIVADERVHVTMDLFRMGIALKRTGQAKEHFVVKY